MVLILMVYMVMLHELHNVACESSKFFDSLLGLACFDGNSGLSSLACDIEFD